MDFEPYEIDTGPIEETVAFHDADEESLRQSVNHARAVKARHRLTLRRVSSDQELSRLLPDFFDIGDSWHIISGGDIDSLSYIAHIVDHEPLDYLLFSSWYLAADGVERLKHWIAEGKIGRLDAYVGEIFPNQYSDVFQMLSEVVRASGCRVCVFRNHSKVFAGCNDRFAFAFAIESSANINTNVRAEQTAIHPSCELFHFYKDYFDALTSVQPDFDRWTPYETRPRPEADRPQAH